MSGAKGGGELREQRLTAASHAALARPGLERDVDLRAGAAPSPELVREARAREQVAASLVDRHRQHARIGPVDRLDAVAVVDVEIDVHDAQAVAPGAGDRERRVVVDAEAGRPAPASRGGARRPGGRRASTSPRRIASIARIDPPATAAAASCIPWNGGSSPGPMPVPGAPPGATSENRLTTSMYAGSWQREQLVVGRRLRGETRRRPRASRSRSMPGPNRRGVSGCAGPKSYVVDRGPKTSSGTSGMDGTIAVVERIYTSPLLDKLGVRPGVAGRDRRRRGPGRHVPPVARGPDERRDGTGPQSPTPTSSSSPPTAPPSSKTWPACGPESARTGPSGSSRARARRRPSVTWR